MEEQENWEISSINRRSDQKRFRRWNWKHKNVNTSLRIRKLNWEVFHKQYMFHLIDQSFAVEWWIFLCRRHWKELEWRNKRNTWIRFWAFLLNFWKLIFCACCGPSIHIFEERGRYFRCTLVGQRLITMASILAHTSLGHSWLGRSLSIYRFFEKGVGAELYITGILTDVVGNMYINPFARRISIFID